MTARFPIYLNVMTFKVSFYGSCNCCLCLQRKVGLLKLCTPRPVGGTSAYARGLLLVQGAS